MDQGQAEAEEIRKRINLEVDRSPEGAAAILRKWLAENPADMNLNGVAGNGNGAHSEANAA